MAYIIKRAVQHSVFLPESERPPPGVKPGQDLRVPPQDITTTYTTAASAKQPDHTHLRHTTFTDASEYGKCFANVTKMDCVVQRKDLAERYHQRRERKAKRSDQLSEGATSFDQKAHELSSARHWTTSYRADFIGARKEGDWSIAGTKPQVRGGVTAVVPVRCVTEDTGISSFTERFGEYGSAPRDLIADPNAAQLPVKITALEDGTTKGKAHIPGYQGFIPSNVRNPSVVSQAFGDDTRQTIDKTTMTEIYHQNVPGYFGHLPTESKNDKGPRQLTTSTIAGSDYAVKSFSRSGESSDHSR
ncbi:ATPase, P-type (transporting), HAD super, sub IC [Perkinsus olseni]|uniref:ATPase, P-type (Transporting), HAD super, sub IC n=1 Tax=Perkinsus olseni TaxID=32597 RepID=A0A7J6P280_PEROL|nr:ATPase, P-type (transporting), HAD super, sub IC [Perkinsus olseni]KAF4734353.1 ATPase, P-type (transporting), HAD super, sub IC [Perkinsus olseni]